MDFLDIPTSKGVLLTKDSHAGEKKMIGIIIIVALGICASILTVIIKDYAHFESKQ